MASDPVLTKETVENEAKEEAKEASSDAESLYRHTATEERQLVRKLDRRILPIACLLYLFACLFLSSSPQVPSSNITGSPGQVKLGQCKTTRIACRRFRGRSIGKII